MAGNEALTIPQMSITTGCSVFPLEVRLALQRAAETPAPPCDPMARMKAINAAIARARLMHPECFRAEALPPP